MADATAERVVVLDFGGQYTQLIARRVREAQVYCEVLPYDTPIEDITVEKPRGIILSGGPATVNVQGAPQCSPEIFGLGIPVLGICYGMQLMAHLLGGKAARAITREYGETRLKVDYPGELLKGWGPEEQVWMSHGVFVEEIPPGFQVLGHTDYSSVAAMADVCRGLYGVQFHPEVKHTPKGMQVLQNFLYDICGCQGTWTTTSYIDQQVEAIRGQVGTGQVLCALSGGVDSSVAAALVHKAIGDQLICVFVNHGLLRKGEAQQVQDTFAHRFGMNLIYVDAQDRFLTRLAGVTEPEEKRKIIGEEFIRIFEEEAAKLGQLDYLVQGTIYPDVIESGVGPGARLIKSHHNVGGLPENMKLKLLEPLRELFKDEVRQVGEELGLPEEIVWRHPFPGPGLGVRVIGEVTADKLEILREADAIVVEEIKKAGLYREIWQAFAVLPGLRSVGVMGDERTYAYTIGIRAVVSDDAMTADWARLPHDVLARMSNRIVNEVEQVNRVVYDITSKPPATIEWE